MTELFDLSAGELLAAYRSKQLSPVEVTRAVLAHIDAWEPQLHATYALDGDGAFTQAEASQARWLKGAPIGPLDGVPTHGVYLFQGNPCVDGAVNAYLATGQLPGRDLDCPR